jgi:DNA-binding MarR family transcriptional regulator
MPRPPAATATRIDADASLVAGLRLVVMRLARRLRQQAEGDVTASMLSALSSIARLGPLTLGALAAVEQVQPPSMTKIVGKLEDQGLVIREVDDRDRRVVRVRVSPEGEGYVARSRTLKNVYLAERLERLDADERLLLERALPLLERLVVEDDA